MLYRFYLQTDPAKPCNRPHSGSKLPSLTVKEMWELYPDGNFAVIGEIGGIPWFLGSGDLLITEDGNSIPIFPRGSLKKPFEWVCGYVAVGKHTYIAVIGGLLPSFLRRWRKTDGWSEGK